MSGDGSPWRESRPRSTAPLVWFVLVVAAALVVPHTPLVDWIFCPFYRLVDMICPGCGMTRSVTAFVRGDLHTSLINHAAGPLFVAGLGWVGLVRTGERIAGRPVLAGLRTRWKRWATPIWVICLLVVVAYWVLRLFEILPGPV